MNLELDIIYNNYNLEEENNKEYIKQQNIDIANICMITILYHIVFYFNFVKLIYYPNKDHKNKF